MQETGFFARDEPILGLGAAPEVAARAFEHEARRGDRRAAHRAAASSFVTRRRQAGPLPPEARRSEGARPRDAWSTQQGARDRPSRRPRELAAEAEERADFEKAAKAAGFEAEDDRAPHARRRRSRTSGGARHVIDAAFALPQGGVSDPIATDSGTGDRQGAREAGSRRRPSSTSNKDPSAKSC